MDIRREEISTLFVAQELHKILQWAKSEHMEKCTSLKELFKYSEDDAIRKKANVTYFKKWRKRWFKKKHCVVCVNEAAMDRIADDLIERGISCRTRSRDSSVSDHTNSDLMKLTKY